MVPVPSVVPLEPPALPPGLRLLCVGREEPSWVGLSLQLDALGCVAPHLRWQSRPAEVLRLLRDETFDCVILGTDMDGDPAALVRAIRASGGDDPVLVLLSGLDEDQWLELGQEDVELLVAPAGWDSRALGLTVRRAIERCDLRREKQVLAAADRRRLIRERDEAEHLLHQQRLILEQLPLVDGGGPIGGDPESRVLPDISEELDRFYQELLRTYVIMGSGSLGPEIARLAGLFCAMGIGPREALELHLHRVEGLVEGLGNRSTRHVMARADLLALELMIHLAEGYQRRAA